jgi:uncharacterized membrane protein YdjX (TVP38/TMEM64 family)
MDDATTISTTTLTPRAEAHPTVGRSGPLAGAARWARRIVLALLVIAITWAALWMMLSDTGARIREDPRAFGADVRLWVYDHPVSAPAIYIGVYILASLLALPMWWILIIAGYCFGSARFGVIPAVIYSQIGGAVGAALTSGLSHWLLGDWFHRKVEAKTARLRAIDERMGHNGLLVVMLVRLTHVIPFNVANYAFGLTRVSVIDVFIGTLLGNIPSTAFYATLGYAPHLLRHWRFTGIIAAINLGLLIPLALRYLKPEWFKRIGVE